MFESTGSWLHVFLSLLPFALGKINTDDILFGIQWPGEINPDLQQEIPSLENSITVTTTNNERYVCLLPSEIISTGHGYDSSYHGPDEKMLLKPLFEQSTCSYRIESYWTYELCHGKLLRQYHEEKEMYKKAKLQEFILGKGVKATKEKDQEDSEDQKAEQKYKRVVPVMKVDGTEIPYYEVTFEDGTLCDLNSKPRRASLRYVCQPDGKGEVYELKEVATCEYEVVVLTSLLCSHPAYQVKHDTINKIQCHSVSGSPTRPKSLENIERETNLGRYNRKELWNKYFGDKDENDEEEVKLDQRLPTGKWFVKENKEEDEEEEKSEQASPSPSSNKRTVHINSVTAKGSKISHTTDKQLLYNFLTGQHCIQGGTGWWKHEFCYGKTVIQFHEDQSGRSNILLGMWHMEDHQVWLQNHPAKRPKPKGMRKHISNFYSMGDICDLTGQRRVVEVKLKCKESTSKPHSVAIYLVEPNVCEYILVVESNILCGVLDLADDNGIIAASAVPKP